jgi:S1-C subfamily serine protease
VSINPQNDLAVLRADVRGVPVRPLRLSHSPAIAGQPIVVIGSPLGLQESVSEGIVSAVRSLDGLGKIIQITAPLSPGSSGSPVLNLEGDLVGVATLNLKGGQNLNFAVSSQAVANLLRQGEARSAQQSSVGPGRRRKTAKQKQRNEDLEFDKMFAEMMPMKIWGEPIRIMVKHRKPLIFMKKP